MIMENCRLGGRIQEKPGWNERRHSDGGIWTKPHLLNNQVLKKRLCGANCAKCECLDWCGYGKEAVKRGMFDDV